MNKNQQYQCNEEEAVAKRLCSLLPEAQVLRCGDDGGNRADALISLNQQRIAVEIVRYRATSQGNQHDLEDAMLRPDGKLQRAYTTACDAHEAIQHYNVYIYFVQDPRTSKFCIPRTLCPLFEEVALLCAYLPKVNPTWSDVERADYRVAPIIDEDCDYADQQSPQSRHVPKTMYPEIAEYCEHIHFIRGTTCLRRTFGSNLNGGWPGLDEDSLRTIVERKCNQDRIDKYRKWNGGPVNAIGLLVWSPMFFTSELGFRSQCDRQQAIEVIRAAHAASQSPFDYIWLGLALQDDRGAQLLQIHPSGEGQDELAVGT